MVQKKSGWQLKHLALYHQYLPQRYRHRSPSLHLRIPKPSNFRRISTHGMDTFVWLRLMKPKLDFCHLSIEYKTSADHHHQLQLRPKFYQLGHPMLFVWLALVWPVTVIATKWFNQQEINVNENCANWPLKTTANNVQLTLLGCGIPSIKFIDLSLSPSALCCLFWRRPLRLVGTLSDLIMETRDDLRFPRPDCKIKRKEGKMK